MKRNLVAAAVIVMCGCSFSAGKSQQEAEGWAKQMGIEGPIVCALQDGDGDGYVSCTYKEGGEVKAIECSSGLGWCNAGGCRVPRMVVKGS